MNLTKEQSNTLKWLAIILMLIDHIGAVLYPMEDGWRIIGRLAFPLFAFQLAIGFDHTRNHTVQLRNLLIFGLLSQVPYMLAFEPSEWTFNIFFTLAIGYAVILAIQEEQYLYIPLLVSAGYLIPVDYGIYGVLLPIFFYFLRKSPVLLFIAFTFSTVLYGLLLSPTQLYAILAFPLIFLLPYLPHISIKTSKWFFYWFYPIHIMILYIIHTFLQ
ncbi:hypothetical protein JMA_42220 (plasmid) [Jeotgalibacillus malaysiensis]|uniref:Conjugal transfer protein TraX n=1 Tax=Jeotgalibacillus malaysiensis TaxID=1508404 RepID=A0A0B5B022_9BACL|nr:TraX family protein [Jeotgalibacillus malaysiensis]AJD93539.1 hypothetical protein JMA_42220 [Jeotgalibacillus malaysiensis]